MAMMFQSYALFPHMTILGNVSFSLKMKGVDKKARHTKAYDLLDLVGMRELAQRLPAQLSGGQQQRAALITDPRVLLLDEPLSALDPFLRIRMSSALKKLQRELGITFIHVAHGQDEALALADEVVVMNNAVIEQAGTARDVFNSRKTQFVARFPGGHSVITLKGKPYALRSHRLRIVDAASDGLDAAVTSVEFLGTHVALGLIGPGDTVNTAMIPEKQFFASPLDPGAQVRVVWDRQDLHPLAH
jgi:putative spermidine/putrescine transport system ATP-binding protein